MMADCEGCKSPWCVHSKNADWSTVPALLRSNCVLYTCMQSPLGLYWPWTWWVMWWERVIYCMDWGYAISILKFYCVLYTAIHSRILFFSLPLKMKVIKLTSSSFNFTHILYHYWLNIFQSHLHILHHRCTNLGIMVHFCHHANMNKGIIDII